MPEPVPGPSGRATSRAGGLRGAKVVGEQDLNWHIGVTVGLDQGCSTRVHADGGQGDAEATAGQGELATVPGSGLAVDELRRRRGGSSTGGNGEMYDGISAASRRARRRTSMHCRCRASLLVNAATRRTTTRGMKRQAPSAAATYAPHLRYSRYAAITGPTLSLQRLS
jgi:hypothetical protein